MLLLVIKGIIVSLLCTTTGSYALEPTEFFQIKKQPVLYPASIDELRTLVLIAREKGMKISITGSGKSQGGQTVSDYNSICVSLQRLNKLLDLNVHKKEVTVQTGMTWRMLQEYIVPHQLAIKSMQSYNDFSIGGSLGVNVHGQDFNAGPLIETIQSCKLLCSDGTIRTISRTVNPELFALAIGGYGLFGIITEVTLSLTDDVIMEKSVVMIDASQLVDYFKEHIEPDPLVEFYSARFAVGSKNFLEKAIVVTYKKTEVYNEQLFALKPDRAKLLKRYVFTVFKKIPRLKKFRLPLDIWYERTSSVMSRNNFMNDTIESLPQESVLDQYILQEYFIPYQYLTTFLDHMRHLVAAYGIEILNVTARHVHKSTQSFLSYAQQDCCALVLFIPVAKNEKAYRNIITWTRSLINAALRCSGTYYLPYQLLATDTQMHIAYPMFGEFIELKKHYDPTEIFSNQLYATYGV